MAFTRNGYGQVEANQLSAQKTGQIYASLPLDKEVNVLQNGEFMFYDYANGTVNAGKDGSAAGTVATKITEPYLVIAKVIMLAASVAIHKVMALVRLIW